MGKKNKGNWEDVAHQTNEDFDGGMTQMWVGIAETMERKEREGDSHTWSTKQ